MRTTKWMEKMVSHNPSAGRIPASPKGKTLRVTGTSNSDEDAMDEDEAFLDDVKPESSRDKRKVYETEYDSLGNREVEKMFRKDADDIMGIFGIDVRIYHFHR
jgi:hypothetical protein